MSIVKMNKIKEISKIISENYMPDKIILFGSYAKGLANENSDIDLLIIKDSPLPRYKRSSEIYKYFRRILLDIEIIVYTPKEIDKWQGVEQAFITNIISEGKVLYEK